MISLVIVLLWIVTVKWVAGFVPELETYVLYSTGSIAAYIFACLHFSVDMTKNVGYIGRLMGGGPKR